MSVGLGAGGAVGLALEPSAATGTWVTPAIWIPILSENLTYQEERYWSQAIRNQTIDNEVKQGYSRVEGDIEWEVDTRYLPYWLRAARLTENKTGAGPYVYTYTPNANASGVNAAITRALSITIIRNNLNFGYTGCHVTSYDFRIEDAVLKSTMHVIGYSESTQTGTPAFVAPRLLGASAHTISTGVGVTTGAPTLTTQTNFNGFTASINDNGEAQNRINANRFPSYVSFGKTEATVNTELDFEDKSDYTNFVNTTKKSIRLGSQNSATTDRFQLTVYNSPFESYDVSLGSMTDLVMANSVFHIISSGGTNPAFDLVVNTDANIAIPA